MQQEGGVHKNGPQSMWQACVLHAAPSQEKALNAVVQITYTCMIL